MTKPAEFLIPVTIYMPDRMLGRIQGVARHHQADVGALIVELVRRQLIIGGTGTTLPARTGGESTPKRRWDPALDDQLRALHAEGLSDTRIGKALGWSAHTITKHRERLRLPRLYTSLNPNFQRPDPVTTALAEGGGDA